MILGLLAAWATAGTIVAVAPDGPLRPGLPGTVWVAATDDDGTPVTRPPGVRVDGERVLAVAEAATEGVWAYEVVPPLDVDTVTITVVAAGGVESFPLAVAQATPAALEVPRRVDGRVDAAVSFRVSGADLPDPGALQVAVPSGVRVVAVRPEEGGLRVEIDPGQSPFAAFVPVGVRDARSDSAPVWTGIRLRARQTTQLTTDSGATVEWLVGGRRYGPFVADSGGDVSLVFEQYPGEDRATAVLRDELGNETRSEVALTVQGRASLVPLVTGPLAPGRAPPRVYLRAVDAGGGPWRGTAPTCTTPSGAASVVPLSAGEWVVGLPSSSASQDQLVRCSLAGLDEASFRVRAADLVPTVLRLRLYPEELSTDFPVAEMQASLEDARGERLPARGVRVEADLGEVNVKEDDGLVLRGEYVGEAARDAGEDVLRARFDRPPGAGPIGGVDVSSRGWEAGGLVVTGRALDRTGRPLEGVSIRLGAGGVDALAVTGADGWASAVVPVAQAPVVVGASSGAWTRAGIAVPGVSGRGPGSPDLMSERRVRITPGRVVDVSLFVRSPLFTGAAAVAPVRLQVVDRSGATVTDAKVAITASEGSVSRPELGEDGLWHAHYTPPRGDRYRVVTLVAEAEGRRTEAELELEPRPVSVAAGLSFGALSNFARIQSVLVSVDVDVRTRWLGHTILGRAGLGSYGDLAEVETGIGDPASVRMALLPVQMGLLSRRDLRWGALWLGLGGVIAPYRSEVLIEGVVTDRGLGLLPPGLVGWAGVALRVPGGEVAFELRPLALASPGGALQYRGPVGGLGLLGGYRLTY